MVSSLAILFVVWFGMCSCSWVSRDGNRYVLQTPPVIPKADNTTDPWRQHLATFELTCAMCQEWISLAVIAVPYTFTFWDLLASLEMACDSRHIRNFAYEVVLEEGEKYRVPEPTDDFDESDQDDEIEKIPGSIDMRAQCQTLSNQIIEAAAFMLWKHFDELYSGGMSSYFVCSKLSSCI